MLMSPAQARRIRRELETSIHYLSIAKWSEFLAEHFPEYAARPCQPCGAEAGTAEKVAIMRQRAERGEALFHRDEHFDADQQQSAILRLAPKRWRNGKDISALHAAAA